MKYGILLFDADNTILDFDKSEEQALSKAFSECGFHFDSRVLEVYRRNNIKQWQLFELGEIATKREVLDSRFLMTFEELGLKDDFHRVSDLYEEYLHDGFAVMEHAKNVLDELQRTCKLYLVSNGVLSIQNSRMKGSGMDKYFIRRFVSEEIGYPKPQKEYFDYCFSHIDGFDKRKTLIIGDSLTSDIQGGINAGIDTCWFNPKRLPNASPVKPTYEIDDLRDLFDIVS